MNTDTEVLMSCSSGHMSLGQNNVTQNMRGPWECVAAEIFTLNQAYLCIVHYHSKLQVVKQVKGFGVDNLINTCKIICSEYQLPSAIGLHSVTNFVSEKLKNSAKMLSI